MAETVLVQIAVSPQAAKSLEDEDARAEAAQVLEEFIRKRNVERLRQVIAEVHQEVRRSGLTEAEVDAELEAYNAERRS